MAFTHLTSKAARLAGFFPRTCKSPAALLGVVLLAGIINTASCEEPVSKEYKLKAAFLYHFAKFVEWPAARFATPESPIVIGVFRHNPFGDELEKVVKGRKINNRGIIVRVIRSAPDAAKAHVLFVDAAVDSKLGELKTALNGDAVLTVGESPAFERQGGMITFKLRNDSLRFAINKDSAHHAKLKISAQLQKLAAKPGGNQP